MTRGERNNNPGNIDFNPRIPWQGQIGLEIVPATSTDTPRFIRFDGVLNGIRAIARILLHYQVEGYNTLGKIIARWAPEGDGNDAGAYIADIARRTGFPVDAVLDLSDPQTLADLTREIIRHENGEMIYSDDVIREGVRRALA